MYVVLYLGGGGGEIRLFPSLNPVSGMNIIITEDLCYRAVIDYLKETLARVQRKMFSHKLLLGIS